MKLFSTEKTLSLSACLAAVMLLALTPKTSALSEEQTQSWSETGDFNETLTFDKFDDEGGTLTLESVELGFTLGSGGTVQIQTDQVESTGDLTYGYSDDGGVTSSSVSLLDDNGNNTVGDVAVVTQEDITVEDDSGAIRYSKENYEKGGVVADADKDDYAGTGTFNIDVDLAKNFTHTFDKEEGDSVDELSDFELNSDGDMTVTYNYIPEPTSLFLLLMTSGIAVLFKRRRC